MGPSHDRIASEALRDPSAAVVVWRTETISHPFETPTTESISPGAVTLDGAVALPSASRAHHAVPVSRIWDIYPDSPRSSRSYDRRESARVGSRPPTEEDIHE